MAITLTAFIKDSKELLDFSRCAIMATKYKEDVFNFRHYSQQAIELEKNMNSKEILDMVLTKAVDIYFDGTNASDAISAAIKEVQEKTGLDPRELILKSIDRRWELERQHEILLYKN